MKRKKFIKMLMSAGMSRNDAADCATLAQDAQRPYYWVLGDLLNFHRLDFGNNLAWLKIRYTIIHGHNSPACRFFTEIDEVHKMKDGRAVTALETGTSAKPVPVIKLDTVNPVKWPSFDWPPQPAPMAGCAYAIDTTPVESVSNQWPKVNPNINADIVDAIAYAVQCLQRGGRQA